MTASDETIKLLATAGSWFEEQQEAMLQELGWLVEQETPSGAKAEINRVQAELAERFEEAGASTEIIAAPNGNHLLARFGNQDQAPVLAVGHVDTVWPLGTLARKPFKVENGLAFGPGVYDMKAGLIMLLFALKCFEAKQITPNRPLTLLITADEEVGSVTSRALIEQEARKAACTLILEPPLESGALKTARKGVGRYVLKVKGRAAHAGVEPEKGVNALVEMAHQVLAINSLNDYSRGTTLNVGVLQGGTRPNVVPAEASAEIDLRVSTLAEAERISQALNNLRPVLSEAQLVLEGGLNRPPFERTAKVEGLFRQAQEIALTIHTGETLQEGATGGGSDGNFTAALGIPTLDGLGGVGKGAHAEHEQLLVSSLPKRAHLLSGLLALL
ncbi:MAG TPA: M20 family metallopeptidase [Chloroflexia bacterium]|nr:M20 family metallopeptidase [Chloroflexia bacterium]